MSTPYIVLKECVIDHKYYDSGETWVSLNDDFQPDYLKQLLKHGFIEKADKSVDDIKLGDTAYIPVYTNGDSYAVPEKISVNSWHEANKYKLVGELFPNELDCLRYIRWRASEAILRQDAKWFRPNWNNRSQQKYFGVYDPRQNKLRPCKMIDEIESTIMFPSRDSIEESFAKHKCDWIRYLKGWLE